MCKCKIKLVETHQTINELRQAAIDAAVDLDEMKNNTSIDLASRNKASRIVERIFAACEALDVTPESYIKPATFARAV